MLSLGDGRRLGGRRRYGCFGHQGCKLARAATVCLSGNMFWGRILARETVDKLSCQRGRQI
jgi:hypothetical protein